MPNLYVTPQEIKETAPDIIQAGTTRYDDALLRLCDNVSRFIDQFCNRIFHPRAETRYYNGNGKAELRIDDVISISALSYSEDDGATYTALTESGNWLLTRGEDYNHPGSYDTLRLNPNSTVLSSWPTGQRSIKAVGIFSYADNRTDAWEDSQDEVENSPSISSSGTSLTLNDVDGANLWGSAPRLHAGLLIRMESEYCEITAIDTELETATIVRARNGTTGAIHLQNIQVDVWRPPEPVKQAAMIMAVRSLERALQGYGDTRAQPDVGQLFFLRKIDPEAQELLMLYRKGQSR